MTVEDQDRQWEQVKAYEQLLGALEAALLPPAGMMGPKVRALLAAAADRWFAAAGKEGAFLEIHLAAQVARLASVRDYDERLAGLIPVAVDFAARPACKPLRPVPDHIRRINAAISGE